MEKLAAEDWGSLDYLSALERQRSYVQARLVDKRLNTLVFVEHPEVITLGRKRAAQENVLSAGDVPVIQVERGGDATWHGPGQLVAYPIVKLPESKRDAHVMLRALEESLVGLLQDEGLKAMVRPKFTGVWVQDGTGELRKIASIGIAIEGWCTYHGVALNVDCDLSGFAKINPCGLQAEVMTSMKACGVSVTLAELKRKLHQRLAEKLTLEAVT